jgi:hypothetical protein
VIAVELAVTGALLFQIRYFAPRGDQPEQDLPDPRLRLAIAVVLGATLFGSLEAMLHGGDRTAAAAVMIGLAVSLLPILLRVLPPLRREAQSHDDVPMWPSRSLACCCASSSSSWRCC